MVLVKIIDTNGNIRIEHAYENPCQLEIDVHGGIKILKPEKYCKVCGGKGGVQYWYAQDESVTVNCPVCNGGDWKRWNKEKENWINFIRKT